MRAVEWVKSKLPSQEELLGNRWMRPFARYLGDPNIWHFNRRSVARGVALGLFFGILIPIAQTPIAAIFAVPTRANLAVAAICTFVTNPFTTIPIYIAAYNTGTWMLQMRESSTAFAAGTPEDWFTNLLAWLLSAPLPTAAGLFMFSVTSAVIGYGAIHIGWRWFVARRWAARRERQRLAAEPAE